MGWDESRITSNSAAMKNICCKTKDETELVLAYRELADFNKKKVCPIQKHFFLLKKWRTNWPFRPLMLELISFKLRKVGWSGIWLHSNDPHQYLFNLASWRADRVKEGKHQPERNDDDWRYEDASRYKSLDPDPSKDPGFDPLLLQPIWWRIFILRWWKGPKRANDLW